MKRPHLAHSTGDQAGPDAAGATWKTRPAPMRQGPLDLLRLSTETLERAGRRPAPAFRTQVGGRWCRNLLTAPSVAGTDGNLSCGVGVMKRRGNSPLCRSVGENYPASGCRTRPSMPPAIVTTWPVTWPESSSEASTTTCRATSSGRATFSRAIVRVTR
jgi:hypothetical protein